MGLFTLFAKINDGSTIASQYHLIEKEVILDWCHLTAHIMKPTKPHIRLLCNRGIEVIFAVFIEQFRVGLHAAALLAKLITGLVFRRVVEGVHTHPNPLEELHFPALNLAQSIAV
jgi:hypothetical protein